jgi:phytoene dehydrogenase-like protein
MSSKQERPEVIIIGAGLAGLACARQLQKAHVPFVILEAADGIGGRVRTDEVEGFHLDRGFQVLLTAYPEAQRLLNYEALDLMPFISGADIFRGGLFHRVVDPKRHGLMALKNIPFSVSTLQDMWRVILLRKELQKVRAISRKGEEMTTESFLEAYGFSSRMVDRFFRPFFGGIFLERELRTSSRAFQFIYAMLSAGLTTTPRLGMGAIPAQLASHLSSESIRLNCPVRQVEPGKVTLMSGEILEAKNIVLAVDETSAQKLISESPKTLPQRACTCFYFASSDASLPLDPIIYLDGEGRGPVNNAAILSNVSANLAPAGQRLISATVLGNPSSTALETAVREQLTRWFGPGVAEWRNLRTYTITQAQSESRQMRLGDRPSQPKLAPGLYQCGDYLEDVSINGALLSGRRAAEVLLELK